MTAPNYNEQSAQTTATPYRRVWYIGFWNPEYGPARAELSEAEALYVNGKRTHIKQQSRNFYDSVDQSDTAGLAAKTFDLRHPETDAVIGSMSYLDLLIALRSYGRHKQREADAANNVPS